MGNNSESEKQIREINDGWAAAVEAKDIDGILANYTDDVVVFDVPPPMMARGRDEYRKHWEDWLKTFNGPLKCEFKETEITAGENVAFLSTLTKVREQQDPDSGAWVRVTVGYRKIDDKWLATHEHVSIPAGGPQ